MLPRRSLRVAGGAGIGPRPGPPRGRQAGIRQRGAGRLYWHTQEYNGRARSLYDQVARPTSFVVYEM